MHRKIGSSPTIVLLTLLGCAQEGMETGSGRELARESGGPGVAEIQEKRAAPETGALDSGWDTAWLTGDGDVPAATETVRFAAIGDYGRAGTPEANVATLVKSWVPDLVITLGDNNYENGEASTIDANIGQYYQQFIGNYRGSYGPGSAVNRFFPSLGNHDWRAAGALPYLAYFTLPGNERYYDFVQGPVHFFAIDSDTNEPSGTSVTSTQANWLRAGLAASTSTWNVVYFHHPPYSSSSPSEATTRMRWPFREWGADVVLAGHHHAYERLSVGGLPYIVNGLGGTPNIEAFGTPVSGSQVRYNSNFGALRGDASDEEMTLEFINRAGTRIDTLTLDAPTPSTTTSFQNGVSPTTAYAGTTDATISQGAASLNAGASTTCRGEGEGGADLSCLLEWNVTTIPAGRTVTGASLVLHVRDASTAVFSLSQILRPWVESQVTWRVYATGLPWTVTGARSSADRGPAFATVSPTATGSLTVPFGSAGIAVVQGWVDAPSTNHGLMLYNATTVDRVSLSSSEVTTASQRPRLVVTWR